MATADFAPDRSSERHSVIEQELQRILESEFFARSPRSTSFLKHIVVASLSGKVEDLKERTLGVEVFDRDPDYDTGEDAIVRVKANEVRRRLAQFNSQNHSGQVVRIELPAGSYAPQFHWLVSSPPAQVQRAPVARRFSVWFVIVAGLLAVLVAGLLSLRGRPALERFWEPVLASSKPAMICLGHPVVYLLSKRIHDAARKEYGSKPELGPTVLKLSPREILGSDVIPASDQFVGLGDAKAGFLLGTFLKGLGKSSEMRIGTDVPFSDLRDFPVILIGAFSNRWTMQISNQFRFTFEEDVGGGNRRVVDRMHPGRSWQPPFMGAAGRVTEDYAIISRIIRSQSGQIMISAAGITQSGCQAAGELLSDPQLFSKAVAGAPPNWPGKNFQAVVKTKIFGESPGPPEVVATYFW